MFKINFEIPSSNRKIDLKDRIYLLGSCFSDEIGGKLSEFKFTSLSNPFGTIYNPISIFKLLSGAMDPNHQTSHQDVHYHWDAHGEVSALNEQELEEQIANRKSQSTKFLEYADWIIITLGTAFVYRLKTSGEIVANCHKAPGCTFSKELLSVEEIVRDFRALNQGILQNKQVLFTVSPVRHIRDGLIENNHSKSILIQAVREIVHSNQNAHYFPSYEIMMDELRDYRFYKRDMIHPSEEAVDYIWERFVGTFMDQETQAFIKKWNSILQAIHHSPFQPKSNAHQKFLKETIRKLDQFKEVVDISVEQQMLEQQLI